MLSDQGDQTLKKFAITAFAALLVATPVAAEGRAYLSCKEFSEIGMQALKHRVEGLSFDEAYDIATNDISDESYDLDYVGSLVASIYSYEMPESVATQRTEIFLIGMQIYKACMYGSQACGKASDLVI